MWFCSALSTSTVISRRREGIKSVQNIYTSPWSFRILFDRDDMGEVGVEVGRGASDGNTEAVGYGNKVYSVFQRNTGAEEGRVGGGGGISLSSIQLRSTLDLGRCCNRN